MPQEAPLRRDIPAQKIDIGSLFPQRDLSWSMTGFSSGPTRRRSQRAVILFSWLAAGIDVCLLTSLSCIFVLSFGLIVQTEFAAVFQALTVNPRGFVFFSATFLVASWFYMVLMRGMIGCSLGEWACGITLGDSLQRIQKGYILRVILRETLLVASGIFILPILSFLFATDLLGMITGLKLISKY